MRSYNVLIFFVALTLLVGNISAQEFNFQINLSTPKIQNVDPKVFRTLETSLQDFLANRRWTTELFDPEERINCNIQITINNEINDNTFDAEISIQASRPVYGTTYETTIFNHLDKDFVFQFEESRPLIYADNIFTDNLTQVLAFYLYMIIGLDYDSFSPYGGDRYFQIAQEVLNVVPTNDIGAKGWRANDGTRNRYWLIENLLSPRVRPFRKAFYDYHRLGLDRMYLEPEKGRQVISESLEELEKVNISYPNAPILIVFINSKSQELVDIFTVTQSQEKTKVFRILSRIDPSASARLAELRR
jgi:hypothetical protein